MVIRNVPHCSGCDGAFRDLVALLKANLSLLIDALHNGDELHEVRADLVAQEAVHLQGVIGIGGVDSGQDVELHLVLLQESCGTQHLVECRSASFIHAIGIVHGLRAIQTQPNQEVVLAEKLAPVVIQEDAIGLHRMPDCDAWTRVVCDVVHRALEKVQSHQGGFTALPGDSDFGDTLRFDHLADVGFERLVAHAKAAVGVELLLGEEKAVGAIQVAGCAGWFAQNMKVGGAFFGQIAGSPGVVSGTGCVGLNGMIFGVCIRARSIAAFVRPHCQGHDSAFSVLALERKYITQMHYF